MESYVVKLLVIYICFGLVVANLQKDFIANSARHRLIKLLTEGYNTGILPVKNVSHAVPVQFDMSLNQLLELFWRDEFLTWDPAEYDGITDVFVTVDTIWRPDFVLYNSVDMERSAFEVIPVGMAKVTSEGYVNWPAPVILQSMCTIKIDKYPFDEQKCPLMFGSWLYNGASVNLTAKADKISLNNYVKSIEWEVLDTPCETNFVYYDCCPTPYIDVTCSVVMRRRPTFYLFNLVFPTVLLLMIGLLVFCLPPESGEKVSLAITVLLAMSVYMLIVMDNVPPSADAIPLLEMFIGATLGMLTLSTIMAVFVVNISFRGAYSRPPYWLRSFCFKCLAYICCLRQAVEGLDDNYGETVSAATSYQLENGTEGSFENPMNNTKHSGLNSTSGSGSDATLPSQRMCDRNKEKKEESAQEAEWRIIAMIFDRLFFITNLILTLTMSLMIFNDVM